MNEPPMERLRAVSIEIQQRSVEYKKTAANAAWWEAEYRHRKAIHVEELLADGRSAAAAVAIVDANRKVAEACRNYKVQAATADADAKYIIALKHDFERCVIEVRAEQAADAAHARVGT